MKKILVVDDDGLSLKLVRDLLEIRGYDLITGSDGTEGIKLAISEKPDLLLIDNQMPSKTGLDVTRDLRKMPDMREIRIIIMSASTMKEEVQSYMDAGCDDFVAKPIMLNDLLTKVSRVLGEEFEGRE